MPVFYLPATGFILSKGKKRTSKANNFSYTLSGKQSRIVGHAKKQSQITESQEKKKSKDIIDLQVIQILQKSGIDSKITMIKILKKIDERIKHK